MAANKINKFDEDIKDVADRLANLIYEKGILSISAPLIKENLALIAVDISYRRTGLCEVYGQAPLVMANPRIIRGENLIQSLEDCVLDRETIYVRKRFEGIQLEFYDIDGNVHERMIRGLLARCIQHEIEHLNNYNPIIPALTN